VIENLADAPHACHPQAVPRSTALETFPVLQERRRQAAGTLSGGEQQMLALARVLAAPPRLLVADEMSLGLAPRMVDLVFDGLRRAKADGVTIVLVEQYVERALAFADDAIVMRQGESPGAGRPPRDEVVAGYLGTSAITDTTQRSHGSAIRAAATASLSACEVDRFEP
jgi:branched-chain amino acid transport system ATP-binding protein